jgi:hypothetical protein
MLSQVFFSRYLSSWVSSEPHHSGFKSQIVALSLWCVMFLLRRFNFFLYCFEIFLKLLLTIPVVPKITGITKRFMFYIRWISELRFLYFNLFSASLCITFLYDDVYAPAQL